MGVNEAPVPARVASCVRLINLDSRRTIRGEVLGDSSPPDLKTGGGQEIGVRIFI